jgi:hypothetical protein
MGRKLTVSGAKSEEHQVAENEEGGNQRASNVIPPLAPLAQPKEEVLDLLSESKPAKEEAPVSEETHAEIPTEEFHAEEIAAEEPKPQEVNA